MMLRRTTIGIVAAAAAMALAGCSGDRSPKVEAGGPPPITTTSTAASPAPVPGPAAMQGSSPSAAPVQAAPASPAQLERAVPGTPTEEPPPPPPPASAPPAAKPSEPPWDPLKKMEDDKAKEASKKLLIADQEEKIRALEVKIDELQKRRLTIFDPFLPPPQLPPDEEKAWQDLSGPQRIARVDGQILEAQQELTRAGEELARLKQGVY